MILLAGVDGGATKTVAAVGRLDGVLIGTARTASSNYHNVGVEIAARSIREAIRSACSVGRASAKNLETVVMGLAAMDSPRDFLIGRRIARLTGTGKHRLVKHDSVIALYAATLGKPGIVVNAGTGSFAAGIDEKGNIIRAGGWGNIIDDEGSAYDIGKLGIRAALRAHDGRQRRTAIAELLVEEFRLRTLEDIVHEVHERPMTVIEISAVSKLVARAALRGDHVARDILTHEGKIAAGLVSTVARRLGMTNDNLDVYCAGGVFNAGAMILHPFRRELRKNLSRFRMRRPRFEPAVGAFILALREEGIPASGRVLRNLQASCATQNIKGSSALPSQAIL